MSASALELARTSSAHERASLVGAEHELATLVAETAADDAQLQAALASIDALRRDHCAPLDTAVAHIQPAQARARAPEPEPEPREILWPSEIGGALLVARQLLAFSKVLHDRLGEECAASLQAVPHDICLALAQLLPPRVVAVVIDAGSSHTRVGFAGEDAPRSSFPTIVGVRRQLAAVLDSSTEHYVGDEALAKRSLGLHFRYPIERGIVTDFDLMHKIWHHAFYSESALHVAPESQPILLTEAVLNPKVLRERMVQSCFESLRCTACFVATQEVLALYATGRRTGVVLTCGAGTCNAVPIYEGYSMAAGYGFRQTSVTGQDLTFYLIRLLHERGMSFNTVAERELARELKEHLCYVALDFDAEMQRDPERTYLLRNGDEITLGTECFRCPEALFNPDSALLQHAAGRGAGGVHKSVHHAVMQVDEDLREELFGNIVLNGASTMFPGMPERLKKEVAQLLPDEKSASKVEVVALPHRTNAAWIGGSIMASLSTFRQMWVTREEYEEVGPAIVHRKCYN